MAKVVYRSERFGQSGVGCINARYCPGGRGRHVEVAAERLEVGPACGAQRAQIGTNTRPQALRVAVAHQDIGWCAGQKALQFALAAAHRLRQAVGVEQQAAGGALEAQVVAEHHPVVFEIARRGTAQVDAEDRQAPAGQPAQQAMHHQPQGEVGEGPTVLTVRLVQGDFGQAALLHQARAEAVEDQAAEGQHPFQRRAQGGLAQGDGSHEGEAAGLHAPGVHAEELVVHARRQSAPELAVERRRHTPVGALQRLCRQADALQQRRHVEPAAARLEQRLADQLYRDGALLHCHAAPRQPRPATRPSLPAPPTRGQPLSGRPGAAAVPAQPASVRACETSAPCRLLSWGTPRRSGNVLAAADDHVLAAPDNLQIARLVHHRQITAVHPLGLVDALLGRLLVVPVAEHHAVAAGADSAMNMVGTPIQHRGALLGHRLQGAQRLEGRAGIDHGAAVGHATEIAHHHAETVVQRHRDHHAVLFAQPQTLADHVAVVEDVVVAQRRALGKAGGTRGVLDVDRVVELQLGLAATQHVVGDLPGQAEQLGPAEHAGGRRARQADHPTQLGKLRGMQPAGRAIGQLRDQLGEHGMVVGALELLGADQQRQPDCFSAPRASRAAGAVLDHLGQFAPAVTQVLMAHHQRLAASVQTHRGIEGFADGHGQQGVVLRAAGVAELSHVGTHLLCLLWEIRERGNRRHSQQEACQAGASRRFRLLRRLRGFRRAASLSSFCDSCMASIQPDFSTFIGRAALDGAWQGFADSGTGVAQAPGTRPRQEASPMATLPLHRKTLDFLARPQRMLIGAQWLDAANGNCLQVRNPATGEPLASVPSASAADVDRAVQAARTAFYDSAWSRTRPRERQNLLCASTFCATWPGWATKDRGQHGGAIPAPDAERGFPRLYPPRGGGGGRRHRGLELSAAAGLLEARSGAGQRLHPGAQTADETPAERTEARRAGSGGRLPGRGVQRGHRHRPERRRGAVQPTPEWTS
ncbi:hypothetical protein L1887_62893 [Cichorium endivia]|nr:hypothetical protein L1887_62893 [Cichorium endivia]